MAAPRVAPSIPPGDAADNRAVMTRLADAFNESRGQPWPQVVAFLERLPKGIRVLDAAAGNARHARAAHQLGLEAVAVDVARPLLAKAAPHPVGLVEADVATMPFGGGAFQALVFVAGVHCLRGRAVRRAALAECRRVMAPRGSALVTVWSRDQPRFADQVAAAADQDTDAAGRPLEPGDIMLPWRHGVKQRIERYFHLYTRDELRTDMESAGWRHVDVQPVRIARSAGPDNWFATAYA